MIIHKIDRSARNLRDWALFSELPDIGVNVYVATESLDFNSRGGRLTADIQAVIAADYIRNLREECVKGIRGRLKQGLYPFKAPLGYLDHGKGQPKTICPKTGPLVRLAFEFYASRQYSYLPLLEELHQRGLRNSRGGRLTLNGLSKILQNQFYIGLMHIKSTGQTYKGVHEPLISIATWRAVQDIRENRSGPKITKHNHLFQGLFQCDKCGDPMVPELQKGRVYYRCKRTTCPTMTIREDVLEASIRSELKRLELSGKAYAKTANQTPLETVKLDEQRDGLTLQVKCEQRRLDRLQDLLLDEVIDRQSYNRKRGEIQLRLSELSQQLAGLPDVEGLKRLQSKLAELQNNLVFLYENATRAEKRCIVENVWPNRSISGKKPVFKPDSWLLRHPSEQAFTRGALERDRERTFIKLCDILERSQQNDEAA